MTRERIWARLKMALVCGVIEDNAISVSLVQQGCYPGMYATDEMLLNAMNDLLEENHALTTQ